QPIGGSFEGWFGAAHAAPAATSAARQATARRALTGNPFDPRPCVPTPLPGARLQLRALLPLLALRGLHRLGLRPAARVLATGRAAAARDLSGAEVEGDGALPVGVRLGGEHDRRRAGAEAGGNLRRRARVRRGAARRLGLRAALEGDLVLEALTRRHRDVDAAATERLCRERLRILVRERLVQRRDRAVRVEEAAERLPHAALAAAA